MREGGGGRGLGGLGDGQKRRPGTGERLDADLPVDGVDEYGGVEAHVGSGTGPARPSSRRPGGRRAPPACAPAARPCPPRGRAPWPRPAPARRRRRGGLPHPGRRTRSASRATGTARRTPPPGGALDLSLRQNRYQQPVVIGDNPSELSVVSAQRETESAQMRHPLCFEPLTEAVAAGPHDSEHDTPRASFDVELRHRIDPFVHPYAPTVTRTPSRIIFHSQSAAVHRKTLGARGLSTNSLCTSTVTKPRAASIHLARHPHHGRPWGCGKQERPL